MGDENPQENPDDTNNNNEEEKNEEGGGGEDGEAGGSEEGEGLEGEDVGFVGPVEARAPSLSDFCEEEEFSEEEYQGGEWVCREVEEGGEYYEEGLLTPGEFEGEKGAEVEIEEKRSLDSAYLKGVLGTPLTYALLDIATKRPTDPIQYLGHYLLRWRWCGENQDKYEKNVKELTSERMAYVDRLREKERQEMLVKEEELEAERRAEKVESTLDGDDDDDNNDFGESQHMLENKL